MKKVVLFSLLFVVSLALSFSNAFALESADGTKLSGPHFQFNIIGHPNNNFGGDFSNGRTIMVPLKTTTGPSEMACTSDGVVITDDTAPTYTTSVPATSKIYFEVCETCASFQIADRDALDGKAKVLVPASALNADGTTRFDIYLRVLGKPNQCMEINAYAYDVFDGGALYFWAGSAELSRKGGGKSTFVWANDLFDVFWCEVGDTNGDGQITELDQCVSDSIEMSVFNDVFEEYFWNILNDGTRNVQVRMYY